MIKRIVLAIKAFVLTIFNSIFYPTGTWFGKRCSSYKVYPDGSNCGGCTDCNEDEGPGKKYDVKSIRDQRTFGSSGFFDSNETKFYTEEKNHKPDSYYNDYDRNGLTDYDYDNFMC